MRSRGNTQLAGAYNSVFGGAWGMRTRLFYCLPPYSRCLARITPALAADVTLRVKGGSFTIEDALASYYKCTQSSSCRTSVAGRLTPAVIIALRASLGRPG